MPHVTRPALLSFGTVPLLGLDQVKITKAYICLINGEQKALKHNPKNAQGTAAHQSGPWPLRVRNFRVFRIRGGGCLEIWGRFRAQKFNILPGLPDHLCSISYIMWDIHRVLLLTCRELLNGQRRIARELVWRENNYSNIA